ncbi:MAG: hypothetical protein GX161_06840 [Firmicutes bacterium]|jgi:hypothetical protein|nr:hypothetical protein [Bacillota bacterium]
MSHLRRFAFLGVFVLLVGVVGVLAAPEYVMVDILDWVNNDGISTAEYPGDQDLDGVGYGFPAEQLPEGDFTVAWDDDVVIPFMGFYMEDGWGNNIEAWGDTIDVPAGNYSGLWLLVVTHHGPVETYLILNYADGTSTEYVLVGGDWCGDPAGDERMVIRPPYRHSASGEAGPSCGMWLLPKFEVDPTKELVSITLPDEDRLHIFGITLEK